MVRLTLVLGLFLVGLTGVASAAPSDSAGKKAQLQLMDTRPLAVRGVGFVPGERVHVLIAVGNGMYGKTKIASSAGTFSVTLKASVGACGGYWLRAFGSKGSRAGVVARRVQIGCFGPGTDRRSSTERADRTTS